MMESFPIYAVLVPVAAIVLTVALQIAGSRIIEASQRWQAGHKAGSAVILDLERTSRPVASHDITRLSKSKRNT